MNYQTSKLATDSDDWANRSAYWNAKAQLETPKRKRREKAKTGLVLTGHGLSINVDKGRLIIRDGFTYFPQTPITKTYFKGALDIPPRIVLVDGKGSITLDALDWLSDQKVDLIRLRYDGRIQSVSSASGYSAEPKKVVWQNRTRANEALRVKYAIPLIRKKTRETLYNLKHLLPASHSQTKAIETAKAVLDELRDAPPATVSKLLAIEGRVAQGYFFAWRALEINWKAENKHPIPDEWRKFFSRSSLKSHPATPANRRATHPINAMLNYTYGMLESRVRIEAISDGFDPSIGIMHDRVSADRHSYVYDQMEPIRPLADRAVLKLIKEETFSGVDFELQSDGVCRLTTGITMAISSFQRIIPLHILGYNGHNTRTQ